MVVDVKGQDNCHQRLPRPVTANIPLLSSSNQAALAYMLGPSP